LENYVPVQPNLINAYKDFPVFIIHPDTGGLVRFLPRSGTYSDTAIRRLLEQGIRVFVTLLNEREHREKFEQSLLLSLAGPFDQQKAAIVRDFTLMLVHETLTRQELAHNPQGDVSDILLKLQELAEYYVALVDLDSGEDILRLMHRVMSKDLTTATHSVNVMILTLRYLEKERKEGRSEWLQCVTPSEDRSTTVTAERYALRQWALAALLHDIGKVMVPDQILKARRRLSSLEYRTMKMHVEHGWKIINRAVPQFSSQRVIVRGILDHHERMDGSGYPLQLADVSLPGQIIGMLDCYEALTTDKRPYRSAASPPEALRVLKEDTMNAKFSPDVYMNLVRLVADL